MLQHLCFVIFRVQESLTQPQNHHWMNKNKCRMMNVNCVMSLQSTFLSWTELGMPVSSSEPKFATWSQRHWHHPGVKVRQPKLLRMIDWYKMVQPCCYILNQFDGNSSVCQISNEAAAKSSTFLPEAKPLFKSEWAFSNVGLCWGSCWDGLRIWDCILKFSKEFKL